VTVVGVADHGGVSAAPVTAVPAATILPSGATATARVSSLSPVRSLVTMPPEPKRGSRCLHHPCHGHPEAVLCRWR
jgi:hypothetical protein